MSKCNQCRFWSQMCAQAIGGGPLEALCLATGGPMQGKYTPAFGSCHGFKESYLGSVDEPPNYGEYVRAAYLENEGTKALEAAPQ